MMRKIYFFISLILIFSLLNSFSSYSGRKVLVKNKTAANFELQSLAGNRIALDEFKGHLVVLNFWASWNTSCMREMPILEKLYQTYKHQGVQVLGIAVVSNKEDIRSKVKFTKVSYPILLGNKELIAKYGSFSDLPTTFIIDQNAQIVRRISGSNSFKTLEQEIISYLNSPDLTKR